MTPPRNPWALMALELRDVAEEMLGPLDEAHERAIEHARASYRGVRGLLAMPSKERAWVEAEALGHADQLAAALRALMERVPDDAYLVGGYKAAVVLAVGLRVRLDAESRKGLDS